MSPHNLNWTVEYYDKNIEKCNLLLKSLDAYNQIPCVNYVPLQNLKDGTLVRYLGMVQDMLNPEYYFPSYTVVNTSKNESYEKSGKFRDVSSCEADEKFKENDVEKMPKERQVFFCIPIPGSNEWVEAYFKKEVTKGGNHMEEEFNQSKRKMDCESRDNEQMELSDESDNCVSRTPSLTNYKKTKTENENENGSNENNEESKKKVEFSVGCNLSNYFPFQKENGVPCIVKTYDNEDGKSNLVLNNAIEVIGFLSLNPALEADWEDVDLEDKALHPPPSLVPRIHAILINKLNHCNPLLKQNMSFDLMTESIEKARSDLLLVLTQFLFEDAVAAEYFLCHLLSKVYVRTEGHTIGQFSLNLYNIKHGSFGRLLNGVLQKLVTNSHYLPLSVDFLNESTFVPKKDYETNRLQSGILQMCDDTHLILDETNMDEGRLKNQGCLNVLALQRLFKDQEVQYDFCYYPVTYTASIPLLVLSEGKSMFEADVRVKVKSESSTESSLEESYEAVNAYLNEEISNHLRVYLTSIRLTEFELGGEMMKKIGEDYVTMRQSNEKFSSEDLHVLLVLSRLLALSRGRKTLTAEDWSKALEMESERKSRLTK